MTKQEQIKEIAQCLCRRSAGDICIIDRTSCDCKCFWANTAEAIYNAGYRKVLLDTKDGCCVDVVQYAPWQLIKGYTEREVERTRKETAEEILQCLYDKCFELGEDGKCSLLCDVINILHLAKQYGVEVEE